METGYMSISSEETIQLLLKTNKEQEETIQDLRTTVKELRTTIANLNETLEELKRKLFGVSSERTCGDYRSSCSEIGDLTGFKVQASI